MREQGTKGDYRKEALTLPRGLASATTARIQNTRTTSPSTTGIHRRRLCNKRHRGERASGEEEDERGQSK